jgi:hypothetical protein
MKNTELEKYLNESRNIYFNNNVRGYSTIVSIFSDLSKVSYDRSESLIEEHLYHKFLNSNSKNFDRFLKSYLGEEGVQISANIPQAVRPERPVDEEENLEELEEKDESDEESEDNDSKEKQSDDEDDELTDDDRVIENFLDEIGLLHLEEEEVDRFIYRFVYVLEDTFEDKDTLNLIASLLYKARMKPEELSDGDKDELTDIIFHLTMNPDEAEEENKGETKEESYLRHMYNLDQQIFTLMSEKDDDKKDKDKDKGDIKSKTKNAVHKVGVVSVLAGSAFLFGIGGLFAAGLFLFLTRSSDKDLEKTKEECTKNKDNLSSGTPVKIENPKPVSNPTPAPQNSISEISSKGESSKEDLVERAKTVAAADPDFAKKQNAKASWKDKFKAAAKYVGKKGVELLGKGAKAVGGLAVDAAKAGYNIATSEPVKSAVKKGLDVAADVGKAGLEKGKDLAKKGLEKGKEIAGKGAQAVKDKFSKKEPDSGEEEIIKVSSKGDAQKYFDTKGKAPKGWESDPDTGKVYPKGKKPLAKKKAPAKKKPATNKPKKSKAEENYMYNLLF